ncbi:hypothetical protein F5Y02DRAFT_393915 [Annulohypoxylon stygium]|nr:hypothetical protein F5Y02DRAFT_393915 [Annulohypoxylon stygium]
MFNLDIFYLISDFLGWWIVITILVMICQNWHEVEDLLIGFASLYFAVALACLIFVIHPMIFMTIFAITLVWAALDS